MEALKSLALLQAWTWLASFGFLAFLKKFIPSEYTDSVRRRIRLWLQSFTPYIFCDVHEFDSKDANTLYPDIKIYLSSLSSQASQRLNLSKSKNANDMTFSMGEGQRTPDTFEGAMLEWVHRAHQRTRPLYTPGGSFPQNDENRSFTLQIGRKDKDRVLVKYLAHIEARAKELRRSTRDLKLYTNSKSYGSYFSRDRPWTSVRFVHPANFDNLALDGDLKQEIIDDLDTFSSNEEYYKRVGKAWKRGYFLYGPPGTGKSSMIAAIANKMRYDVYDLELTEVVSNMQLRKLLLFTSDKSIIVIEDIDCSLDLTGERKKKKKKKEEDPTPGVPPPPPSKREESGVTLSGLLNFVDGLWSCCGSERIFIFTTNHVDKLDPALLRAGRMDMHINLSYCTFSAFQTLARTYLQITDHELFEQLRSGFDGSYMTPADVTGVLLKNQKAPFTALQTLIDALKEHMVKPAAPDSDDENEEGKAKAKDAEADKGDNVKNVKKSKARSVKTGEKQPSLAEKIHPIAIDDSGIEVDNESKSSAGKETANNSTEVSS